MSKSKLWEGKGRLFIVFHFNQRISCSCKVVYNTRVLSKVISGFCVIPLLFVVLTIDSTCSNNLYDCVASSDLIEFEWEIGGNVYVHKKSVDMEAIIVTSWC